MQIADDREMQKEKSGSKVGLHKDKYVLSGTISRQVVNIKFDGLTFDIDCQRDECQTDRQNY